LDRVTFIGGEWRHGLRGFTVGWIAWIVPGDANRIGADVGKFDTSAA
jgi:hypothetical protein